MEQKEEGIVKNSVDSSFVGSMETVNTEGKEEEEGERRIKLVL